MGFGHDESKDFDFSPIDAGAIVPAVVINAEGQEIEIKKGKSAGHTADMYRLQLFCIHPDFFGKRIFPDSLFVNVERTPDGPIQHGNVREYKEVCHALGADWAQSEGGDLGNNILPFPDETMDIGPFCESMMHHVLNVKVNIDSYKDKEGRVRQKNIVEKWFPVKDEQIDMLEEQLNKFSKWLHENKEEKSKRSTWEGDGASFSAEEDDDIPF